MDMLNYRFFHRTHETALGCGINLLGGRRCVGVPLGAMAWAIVCIILVGCGGPRVEPIEHLRGVNLDEPFPGASMASFHAPFDKLDLAIPVAFKNQHWGLLRVQWEPVEGDAGEQSRRVLRASGLLSDGRTAQVVAWPVDHLKFAVAVRVGHFGDRDHERAFLGLLAKTLRTKRTRRPRFELPELILED